MTGPTAAPLDLPAADRRRLADGALALLEQLQRYGPDSPIHRDTPDQHIAAMRASPPEAPAALEPLLGRLLAAAQGGWSKSHGGDLGYIPCGGLFSGAIAALLASGIHTFTGAAFESPALVALEESVLGWMADTLGLPPHSEGILLSGGSMANQTAIVCARSRPAYDAQRGVVYLSEHAHHSLHKALHLSGIAPEQVRTVPVDTHTRIDTHALRRQINSDVRSGLRPWLIVGVAGSTDTGSIDALDELADIAATSGAWLHVDAAYGGFFALTARGAHALQGIARADSVTLDAHKGLQLPYGVGALLVRWPGVLAAAHAGAGAYMRDVPAADDLPHYFDRGPELTRPFRGLLVWLPLHLHGVAAFRQALDSALDLAAQAALRLRALPDIDVLLAPALSIVVWRAAQGDATTTALMAAINGSGRFRVSSTLLNGRVAIRLAFLHHRTGIAELDELVACVAEARGAPSGAGLTRPQPD